MHMCVRIYTYTGYHLFSNLFFIICRKTKQEMRKNINEYELKRLYLFVNFDLSLIIDYQVYGFLEPGQ